MFLILVYFVILFGVTLKSIFKAGVIMIEVSVMSLDKMLLRNLTEDTISILSVEHIRSSKMDMNSWPTEVS
jgi:hypothetical protein